MVLYNSEKSIKHKLTQVFESIRDNVNKIMTFLIIIYNDKAEIKTVKISGMKIN